MRISHATRPGSDRPNEDYVVAGPDWAVVLDGATAPDGVPSGCVHDVVWLVRRLGVALTTRLIEPGGTSLPGVLADAIEEVCAAHADTCDLANPDSPSATVALARFTGETAECLVLADSPIVLQRRDGGLTVITDDRLDHLPGGRPYSLELVRRTRNRRGGFWVAGAEPAAAFEAVTATADIGDLARVALFTDGATRPVEHYGWTWRHLLDQLGATGPDGLIDQVRGLEEHWPLRKGKRHDDATALLVEVLGSTAPPRG